MGTIQEEMEHIFTYNIVMGQEDKENILRKVYYTEDGFGSITETYKEAKKQLNRITIEYTKNG